MIVKINIIYSKYVNSYIDKATLEPQIGDTINTLRTNLGDSYLPCDGNVIDSVKYPKLYSIAKNSTPKVPFKKTSLNSSYSYSSYSKIVYGNGYYAYTAKVSKNVIIFYSTNINGPFISGNSYDVGQAEYATDDLYFLNGYFLFGLYGSGGYYIQYGTVPTQQFTKQLVSTFVIGSNVAGFTYVNNEFGFTAFAGNAWRYIYSKTITNTEWTVSTIGFSGDTSIIKKGYCIGIGNYVYTIIKLSSEYKVIKYGSTLSADYDVVLSIVTSDMPSNIIYDGSKMYISYIYNNSMIKIYYSSDFINFNSTIVNIENASSGYSMVYSNNVFIICSEYMQTYYSYNIMNYRWDVADIKARIFCAGNYICYNVRNNNGIIDLYYIDTSKKSTPFISIDGINTMIKAK